MISFESDYNNGAHPKVLQHLLETNDEQSGTYGFDEWSEQAKAKIREACQAPDAQIWFIVGGTQTNATVIDSMLNSYEGVVAVGSAHINTHEAGAIEFSSHKVITLPEHNGKMCHSELDTLLRDFYADEAADHCVQPGMVYITLPTEYGTLYTAEEVDNIYKVCRQYNLPLYVDGARLGYALASPGCDITLPWLAKHCDAFYIGGTKVGALCGEAVVFTHRNAPRKFFTIVKQHGALMAKGRLIGLQFDALFTDNLYHSISAHAINMAMEMKEMFVAKGCRFYIDSPTNQQFVVLDNNQIASLSREIIFSKWAPVDKDHQICRFVTSWATTPDDMKALKAALDKCL